MAFRFRATALAAAVFAAACTAKTNPGPSSGQPAKAAAPAPASASDRTLRLVGTIEAVRPSSVAAPRFRGRGGGPLTLTRLVKGGTHIKSGEVVAELDSQDQDRLARDRRSTVLN